MERFIMKNNDKDKEIDIINPLDFFDLNLDLDDEDEDKEKPVQVKKQPVPKKERALKQKKAFFITGTDTGVGKTIATCVLGTLLKATGADVGIMKPVQCGGNDALFLSQVLQVKDSLRTINPYRAKEEVSPHLAFIRQKVKISREKILTTFQELRNQHDYLFVEGAGGLMVPLFDNYYMIDLIKDLDIELIVVARPGLGTINHTLLTIEQAREKGIKVNSIVFSESKQGHQGLPEKSNPQVINRLTRVPVLGVIPFLKNMDKERIAQEILKRCRSQIRLTSLLKDEVNNKATQWTYWDKKYVWHPYTQMQDWNQEDPVIIDSARGSYLKDINGQKYLDGVSSLWVNVHGHGKNVIDKAIKKQVNTLSHSTLLGLSNTPAIELAKKLVDVSPRGLEKVFYSDNGSTSVEIAIKMAYQYWQNTGKKGKTKIAHLAHSYHGDTLGSVSVGGIDLFHRVYNKIIFKTIQVEFPDFYRTPPRKKYPQYTHECLNKMVQLFKMSGSTIAALVVEPIVQGAAGMIVWPEGLLKRMRELCDENDILLIADEVATGFGRTGKMFACEHENVVPDFLCLAKGLTGGYLPLAATLTTNKIYDGFLADYKEQKTFFHGHTYTGNPLCCSAALANLKVFEKEQIIRRLEPKVKYLEEQLKRFEKLPHVGQVRQKGFMIGIELVKSARIKKSYDWEEKVGVKVCQEAKKKNVLLRPLGNVIVLMPPLSISKLDLNFLLDTTYDAISQVTQIAPAAGAPKKNKVVPRKPIKRRMNQVKKRPKPHYVKDPKKKNEQ